MAIRRDVMRAAIFACGLTAIASPSTAQPGVEGSLAGIVRSPEGQPLADVSVTAASEAVIGGPKRTTTDKAGRYELLGLPPARYTVTFVLPGRRTVQWTELEVHAATRTIAGPRLPPGEAAEIITISERPGLVPSSLGQRTFSRDLLNAIPAAELFTNFAVLVPGMSVTGVGQANYQDVGGSTGNALGALAIHGGRFSDQMIFVNGTSAALWGSYGNLTALTVPDAGIVETVVSYAGQDAAAEAGGVAVNFVPRAGGDLFAGEFTGTFTSGALQTSNFSASTLASNLWEQEQVKLIADVNPAFGGPAVRKHLWSWTSYRLRRRDLWSPTSYDQDPGDWVYVPSSRQAIDDEHQWALAEELTWRTGSTSTATFGYRHDNQCDCHSMVAPGDAPETALHGVFSTDLAQAAWHRAVGARTLVEVGGSWLRTDLAATPESDAEAPAAIDTALEDINFRSRAAFGPAGYEDSRHDNGELFGTVAVATGSFTFRLGTTINAGEVRTDYSNPANYSVLLQNGLPLFVEYLGSPTLAIDELTRSAIFGEGRWAAKRASLYAALRFDRLTSGYPGVTLPPTPLLSAESFSAGRVLDWNDLSPRLAATYDLSGTGATLIEASVSRYVLQEGLDLTQASDPGANARLVGDIRRWTDANLDFIPEGDPLDPLANGEIGASTNPTFGHSPPPLRIDPAAARGWNVRPAQWEFVAALRQALGSRVALAGSFIRRAYTNFLVVDNENVSPADYDGPYCLTALVDPRLPGGGGGQLCGLFDLNPVYAALPVDNVVEPASRFGRQYEHWDGFDVDVEAHPVSGALLQGGISVGRTVSDDCAVVAVLDNPTSLYCHVASPWLADLKLLGVWPLPWGLRLAGTFQSSPGLGDGSGIGAVYSYSYIPALGRNTSAPKGVTSVNLLAPLSEPGDRVNQLNLRLARPIRVGAVAVELRADIYNALNASPPLTWNNAYGTMAGSLTWLRPESILQGRLIAFGVRVSR